MYVQLLSINQFSVIIIVFNCIIFVEWSGVVDGQWCCRTRQQGSEDAVSMRAVLCLTTFCSCSLLGVFTVCLQGKKILSGNNVSHSQRKCVLR